MCYKKHGCVPTHAVARNTMKSSKATDRQSLPKFPQRVPEELTESGRCSRAFPMSYQRVRSSFSSPRNRSCLPSALAQKLFATLHPQTSGRKLCVAPLGMGNEFGDVVSRSSETCRACARQALNARTEVGLCHACGKVQILRNHSRAS